MSRRQAALSLVRQSEGFRSLEGVLGERRRYLEEMEMLVGCVCMCALSILSWYKLPLILLIEKPPLRTLDMGNFPPGGCAAATAAAVILLFRRRKCTCFVRNANLGLTVFVISLRNRAMNPFFSPDQWSTEPPFEKCGSKLDDGTVFGWNDNTPTHPSTYPPQRCRERAPWPRARLGIFLSLYAFVGKCTLRVHASAFFACASVQCGVLKCCLQEW